MRERGDGTAGAYGFFFKRSCALSNDTGDGVLGIDDEDGMVIVNVGDCGIRCGGGAGPPLVVVAVAIERAEGRSGERLRRVRDWAACADWARIWSNGLLGLDCMTGTKLLLVLLGSVVGVELLGGSAPPSLTSGFSSCSTKSPSPSSSSSSAISSSVIVSVSGWNRCINLRRGLSFVGLILPIVVTFFGLRDL